MPSFDSIENPDPIDASDALTKLLVELSRFDGAIIACLAELNLLERFIQQRVEILRTEPKGKSEVSGHG